MSAEICFTGEDGKQRQVTNIEGVVTHYQPEKQDFHMFGMQDAKALELLHPFTGQPLTDISVVNNSSNNGTKAITVPNKEKYPVKFLDGSHCFPKSTSNMCCMIELD